MNDDLISVIVPTYNGGKYLAEALESILTQTYRPIEIIIVDDGSTDNSAQIASNYCSKYLFVQYLYQNNSGPPCARNAGINVAKGPAIAFLDVDDLWAPHKLSIQAKFHRENPRFKYSFTFERFFYEDTENPPGWTRKQVFQKDHAAYIVSSMLVERELFDVVGLFNPVYRNTDNSEWIFRAKDHGYVAGIIEEVLLFRRIHEDNISSDVNQQVRSLLKVVNSSIRRQKENE